MSTDLTPISPLQTSCKCCRRDAFLFGVVDFNRNCAGRSTDQLGPSGIPIYYHRCPSCGFLFTIAFDHFSHEDFTRHIYNEKYKLVDPEYASERPKGEFDLINQLLPAAHSLRILDYGAGAGVLAQLLREAGYQSVENYDPFVPQHSTRPAGQFDCIVCFEVMEHLTDPGKAVGEMAEMLGENGLILFSTQLQPSDFATIGLTWWYVAPRNGHVSLYTRRALAELANTARLKSGSLNENLHVMFRQIPGFARHLFTT